jgi:hypothetical protein
MGALFGIGDGGPDGVRWLYTRFRQGVVTRVKVFAILHDG